MAIVVTVGVSNSCVVNGQVINGTVTVTNTGSSPVNINNIQLYPSANPSISLGQCPCNGPGINNTVPGLGSLSFPFGVTVYAGLQPTSSGLSSEFAFPIGALVSTSDGSYTSAPNAIIQAQPPQSLPYQSPGQFPYTPSAGPLAAVTVNGPLAGAAPGVPVAGQARFDSNLESTVLDVVVL